VEATATGYEVAFQNFFAGLYTVWNTDANGNITANPIGSVSGNSLTLQALETSFHQDLNRDGIIGLPAADTLIETFGSTSLLQTGSNYIFDKAGGGPEFHYDGAVFVAGQLGGWTPIGVEATASGYEVAFKLSGTDQYTVWDTDSAGNMTIDPVGTVSGSSAALVALERSFHQDLNGDGMIGNPSIAITVESSGATSLVLTNNDYFLDANGTSNGPALKYGGAAWTDGEWGGWTPVGAEATATGHEVAFNLEGTNLYTVWNTDSNGNITTNAISSVTAGSAALQAAETSFHQDLNGDGIIGDPSIPLVIESSGLTSLTEISSHFFLYDKGTSNGPELKYQGAAWSAGQWGGWMPIAAETTGAAYDVAFKLTGSDLYTFWYTDADGNMTGNSIGSVPGSDLTLQSSETLFHQDLNGDGTIGLAAPITAPASGNVTLTGTAAADGFVFHAQFGNDTVKSFQPDQDQVFIDHSVFTSITDLFNHMADNASGSAVVTISATQSITFDNVSTLVLQQHINTDFHLV
jgi:serralysin